VPSTDNADAPRLVVDEASFDFRALRDLEIERHLDELNQTLLRLREMPGFELACAPMWEAVECLDGCELYQFLCREYPSNVDRDTLLLSFKLLSQCTEWGDSASNIDPTVSIDNGEPIMALSVGYALAMALARRALPRKSADER
jgi:hypothetical protein